MNIMIEKEQRQLQNIEVRKAKGFLEEVMFKSRPKDT